LPDSASSIRFLGAKLKIERSKRHLQELNSAIEAFMNERPYKTVGKFDANTGVHEIKVSVSKEVPLVFGPMVGDVIHNLRAALDVLAVELARENLHASRAAISQTYFPISGNVDEFKRFGMSKMKRLKIAAQDIICRLKPYKGGNDLLWKLHQLDILDKHVLLVPVAAGFVDKKIGFSLPFTGDDVSGGAKITMGEAAYPLKDGDVIATFANIHPQVQPYVEVRFTIAFGEEHIVDGEPVIPTLHQFGQIVESIVYDMEATPL